MQYKNFDILAPRLLEQSFNEAEMTGAAIWLWMHSEVHHNFPLHVLDVLLFPAIRTGQFVLAVESGKPVFYLSWAMFSEEAEERYILHSPHMMRNEDWQSGDRIWFLDWVAPFGGTREMRNLMSLLFRTRYVRYLHHRGTERNMRIMEAKGADVTKQEASAWFSANPAMTPEYVAARQLAVPTLSKIN